MQSTGTACVTIGLKASRSPSSPGPDCAELLRQLLLGHHEEKRHSLALKLDVVGTTSLGTGVAPDQQSRNYKRWEFDRRLHQQSASRPSLPGLYQ